MEIDQQAQTDTIVDAIIGRAIDAAIDPNAAYIEYERHVAALRVRVEDQRADYEARLEALRTENEISTESLRSRIARHEEDIALVGQALIEKADTHGWCDEYDEMVEDLNARLYVKLPIREKAFTVTVEVTVTARGADDARDTVTYMLTEVVDYDVLSVCFADE